MKRNETRNTIAAKVESSIWSRSTQSIRNGLLVGLTGWLACLVRLLRVLIEIKDLASLHFILPFSFLENVLTMEKNKNRKGLATHATRIQMIQSKCILITILRPLVHIDRLYSLCLASFRFVDSIVPRFGTENKCVRWERERQREKEIFARTPPVQQTNVIIETQNNETFIQTRKHKHTFKMKRMPKYFKRNYSTQLMIKNISHFNQKYSKMFKKNVSKKKKGTKTPCSNNWMCFFFSDKFFFRPCQGNGGERARKRER